MLIFYMISVAALVIALAVLGWQVFHARDTAELNAVMLYHLSSTMKALAENTAKMDGRLEELAGQSGKLLECVQHGPSDSPDAVQVLQEILQEIQGPRKAGALWGEEEQGSVYSFRRKAETEQSGLCDDELLNPEAARKEKEAMDKWNDGIAQILNYDPMSKKDGDA